MIDAIIQIVTGFLGSLGFGILFNVRGRRLVFASLGGFISWSLCLILSLVIKSEPIVYFFVSLLMSLYAEIMARVLKTPTTTFIMTSLIPLIPGSSLYYTMASLFSGDMAVFASKLLYTVSLASALALGIIIATAVTKVILKLTKIVNDKR